MAIRKVRYLEETDPTSLVQGKVYDVIAEYHGYLCVVDESGDDYCYSPDLFEIVEQDDGDYEYEYEEPSEKVKGSA